MNRIRNDFFAGLLPGLTLGALSIVGIGFTSAIAVPKAVASSSVLLVLWQVLVVQFIGIGVGAALLSYISMWSFGKSWLITGGLIVLSTYGYIIARHGVPDLESSLGSAIHFAVLIASIFAGTYLAHRKLNKSLKGDAEGGAR
ncbi:hypothetical protein [Gilvimarinus agarilyticus]|uniref:hypothetical protein n=1 Tax=Gilvimarinus agarilyticus TaxID=679259 RepID=UPI0005A1E374|nr:hypothetical protein [Gilvimarinus agarilyticus]